MGAPMTPGLFMDLVANGLVTGGIYAVVAIGLNLQYGLMRIMNIAHGEFLMLGAYFTYTLKTATGASPLWFLPAVALVLFALGIGVYVLVFRRLVRTSSTVEVMEGRSLIVGFGLMFIIQNLALLVWDADLRGYEFMTDPVAFGGVIMTANRLLVFGLVMLVSLVLILILHKTLLGKAVRGMLQAPLGALLVGVDTRRLHPVIFGVGLALAGVAGGLLSMVYEISPAMGEPYTIIALIVITLGGLGSISGSLLGALLLGLVESFGMHLTNPSAKLLLSYGVFVLVLLLRPKGLFAK